MVADFFTKPTQGKLFRKFRDVVLGYSHIDSLKVEQKESTSQERVRKDKFQKKGYASAMINTTKSTSKKTVTWADIVRGGPSDDNPRKPSARHRSRKPSPRKPSAKRRLRQS